MTIKEANSPVADRLDLLIAEQGIKKKAVAKKGGYTAQEICDMLNNRRLIKATDIPRLAAAVGTTPNVLFGLVNHEPSA